MTMISKDEWLARGQELKTRVWHHDYPSWGTEYVLCMPLILHPTVGMTVHNLALLANVSVDETMSAFGLAMTQFFDFERTR